MILVIKLSGQGLGKEGEKYDEDTISGIQSRVATLRSSGHSVALVVGGGNLFRGRELSGRLGIKRATADYMGMLATVQNALVLRDYFQSRGTDTRVASSIAMPQICEQYVPERVVYHLTQGRLVIFAGGLGNPYFTTDTCAVQRSLEIGAGMLIMAKMGVDGIYTADPRNEPGAKAIANIAATEVIERGLRVADLSAMALAKESGLAIKIVSVDALDTALDEGVGSVIRPE